MVSADLASGRGQQEIFTASEKLTALANLGVLLNGQCRLVKNGSNLELQRHNGLFLFIDGRLEIVPASPITLSPSGLSADTTYNIYAYMISGTMTLEASATAWAVDATHGHAIKTGDVTRTLVGKARTNGSSAFQDDDSLLGVLSYFNPQSKTISKAFTTNRSTSSTTYIELHSEIRCNFICWGDESVFAAVNGTATSGPGGHGLNTAIAFDGATPAAGLESGFVAPVSGAGATLAIGNFVGLSEGFHFATPLGAVSGSTSTWHSAFLSAGATAPATLKITVRG